MAFIRLLEGDGTWKALEDDWRDQCFALGEDFEGYTEATFKAVRDLVINPQKNAAVYALEMGGQHVAICQLNKAGLPKYDSPVLRVRHMTLSPDFDLGEKPIDEYADVLIGILFEAVFIAMNDPDLCCKHLKYHLKSPADQQFFRALGKGLQKRNVFRSIDARGAWLYITLKDAETETGDHDGPGA